MRVLFVTFAAKVHMYSQVPLAWALQTAGHEVRIASQPDLMEAITETGLTGVPVGEALNLEEQFQQTEEQLGGDDDGLELTETRPEKLTWDYVLGVFTAMTSFVFQNNSPESMVDDLVGFARSWKPDLVVWDTLTFAGPVAAEACGAAHARLLFGMDHMARMRRILVDMLEQRPPDQRDDPLAEWLGWTAGRHGVEFDESMVTGQFTIDPTPSWMRFRIDLIYVPMRYVAYNGPSTIPSWLSEPPKAPRICLTLGLSHREVQGGDEASVADLLEAIASLDVEVVATLDQSQREKLPALPDNVRVVDFVPLNALLPTCSAIVSHGGSGTLSTAMLHGVPHLFVPSKIWDSPDKARLLTERGAALQVSDRGLSAETLRSSLARLLDEPSFARTADSVRTAIRATSSPNDIVPVLEKLTAEHASARGVVARPQ